MCVKEVKKVKKNFEKDLPKIESIEDKYSNKVYFIVFGIIYIVFYSSIRRFFLKMIPGIDNMSDKVLIALNLILMVSIYKIEDLQSRIKKWQQNINDAEIDIRKYNSDIEKATNGKLPEAQKRVEDAGQAVKEAQATVEKWQKLAQ